MKLEELQPGLLATILVTFGKQHMEFNTMIEEVSPRKNLIYAAPILRDDKPVSFNSSSVQTHLLVFFEDRTPQIFRNVRISLLYRNKTELSYSIVPSSVSADYNRRRHYRCYVGLDAPVMVGAHRTTYDAIIKDISIGGFSFTVDADKKCAIGDMVHFVLKDYLQELKEHFTISLYGIVVAERELEHQKTVYGCRITSNAFGIDSYIAKKERLRLQKARGGTIPGKPYRKN